VYERGEFTSSLSALAKIKVRSPERKFTAKALIFVQRPGSLRVEVLNFWGQAVFLLLAREGRLLAYSVGEEVVFEGEASPENLSRFIPGSFAVEDVADLLLGGVLWFSRDVEETSVTRADGFGLYQFVDKGKRLQRLWVDPQTLAVIRQDLISSEKGDVVVRIDREDFTEESGCLFPRKIKAHLPTAQSDIEVRYSRLKVNAPLSSEAFTFAPPPGVQVAPFEELSPPSFSPQQ
jgi:outer membrane lipoprotein-sorting protein